MKRTLLMACALLGLAAGVASAGGGGLNLGWSDCGGLAGSLNRTFACNTNVGTNTLVGSFIAPCCVTAAASNEIVVDLQSVGATLPLWWAMNSPGGCRAGSLSADFNFTGGPFSCTDYWAGGAFGSISMDPPSGNRARVKMLVTLIQHAPGPIAEGLEVYSFKMNINNAKTVGTTSCAGCPLGVCVLLNSIKIVQSASAPGGSKFVTAPAVRSYATWQGGISGDCYQATPAKNATWGLIQSLYR